MELSTRLRQATQDLHGVAERSGMMPSLLRGQLSRRDYTRLLRNLQLIYAALERGLAHAPAPAGVDFTHNPSVAQAERFSSKPQGPVPGGGDPSQQSRE